MAPCRPLSTHEIHEAVSFRDEVVLNGLVEHESSGGLPVEEGVAHYTIEGNVAPGGPSLEGKVAPGGPSL